jgi:hypothetical protein
MAAAKSESVQSSALAMILSVAAGLAPALRMLD